MMGSNNKNEAPQIMPLPLRYQFEPIKKILNEINYQKRVFHLNENNPFYYCDFIPWAQQYTY